MTSAFNFIVAHDAIATGDAIRVIGLVHETAAQYAAIEPALRRLNKPYAKYRPALFGGRVFLLSLVVELFGK